MHQKVIIPGRGFAGLRADSAVRSTDSDAAYIDRSDFHRYQPLLNQVGTGSLSLSEIASPWRTVFWGQKNGRVFLGEATHIDPASRQALLSDGQSDNYSTLGFAAGSVTFYLGDDDWRPYGQSLKSTEDFTEMRRRIFTAFERAELEGATGAEVAGAVSGIARKTIKDDFLSIRRGRAQLILVDSVPRLPPAFSEQRAVKAEQALNLLGVRDRCGLRGTGINATGVNFRQSDGTAFEIPPKTVLWDGGVSVLQICRELQRATGARVEDMGRIWVLPNLTVSGHPEIVVAGDIARVTQQARVLSGGAHVALQKGADVGKNILRRQGSQGAVVPFRYSGRGDIAVIGLATAIARVFGLKVWGRPAWFAWAASLFPSGGVFVRWALQYLTFSRGGHGSSPKSNRIPFGRSLRTASGDVVLWGVVLGL